MYRLYIVSVKLALCRVKDIGVFISKDLKWASLISNIHDAASARASHVLRAFSSNNVWTLCQAFIVYVRPIL